MSRSLQLLLLVGGVACAANPPRQSAPPPCPGTQVVAVTNNWNRTIEVYTYSSGGSTTAVGSISPGSRTEFPLFKGVRGISFRVEGARGGGLPNDGMSRVQTQYFCR